MKSYGLTPLIIRYSTNVSATRFDSGNNQLGQTSYAYDPYGRANRIIDARSGGTTNWFNNAGQISSTKTPSPDGTAPGQVTTNFFDAMGRVIAIKLPDNTYVTNKYDVTGLLTNTFGSRTYPVAYTYDAQGRMKTMTTWQNYSGGSGSATTTWNYNTNRGWLDNKRYADSKGPNYTNTPAGRLKTRLWARGVTTGYTYNNAGDLSTVIYSDSTPSVTNTYDRRGRLVTIARGTAGTESRAYGDAGNPLSESYTSGPLNGLTVTNRYDSLLRRTTNGLWNGSAWLAQTRYTYDAASRLLSVSDGTNSAGYSYIANSPLVGQISFTNNGTLRMTTSNTFDNLNRRLTITNQPVGSSAIGFAYAYNTANQRSAVTNADSTRWVYSYDSLGQVISGKKYWSNGSLVAGQQFEYTFDDIGNRKTTSEGGDNDGANLRVANYHPNSLNQYTNRDVPGYVNVIGTANSNAIISLWTENGAYGIATRKGEYYSGEIPVDNSGSARWVSITNVALLNTSPNITTNTVAGNAFVPTTPEVFAYDGDGNLTNDGRWMLTWDAENRLIKMESQSGAPSGSKKRLEFTYDNQSRRTQKIVYTWNGSTYVAQSTNRFAYDGWNLITVLSPQASVIQGFMNGLDLSGSLQGAGGIGGLLVVNDTTNGVHFTAFDGNGNVAGLFKVTDATQSAKYEYGPFGEIIRATGPMASVNMLRFSTKYRDNETDLLYYGYRYLDASTGSWLARDPEGEMASRGLTVFAANNPVAFVDKDGRVKVVFNGEDSMGKLPCGGFDLRFDFSLDRIHDEDGFLVQQVVIVEKQIGCSLFVSDKRHNYRFWETMGESKANVEFGGSEDLNRFPPFFRKLGFTRGSVDLFFQTRWFPKRITGDLYSTWGPVVPPDGAGPMADYATTVIPTWWSEYEPPAPYDEWPAAHQIHSIWNCCCKPGTSTLVYVPE